MGRMRWLRWGHGGDVAGTEGSGIRKVPRECIQESNEADTHPTSATMGFCVAGLLDALGMRVLSWSVRWKSAVVGVGHLVLVTHLALKTTTSCGLTQFPAVGNPVLAQSVSVSSGCIMKHPRLAAGPRQPQASHGSGGWKPEVRRCLGQVQGTACFWAADSRVPAASCPVEGVASFLVVSYQNTTLMTRSRPKGPTSRHPHIVDGTSSSGLWRDTGIR